MLGFASPSEPLREAQISKAEISFPAGETILCFLTLTVTPTQHPIQQVARGCSSSDRSATLFMKLQRVAKVKIC